ncbi:MAG: methyltransferase domain-containing protein [Candidatus Thorarchaeota archaeon]
MRLPDESELSCDEHTFLYMHDIEEYHSIKNTSIKIKIHERVSKIINEIQERLEYGRILDIGCAQGTIPILLSERGFEVYAVDLQREFLRYAQLKDNESHVIFIQGNSLELPFQKEIFDCVILGEIIEHIAYPEKLFSEIQTMLRKNGLLIITTPNGNEIFSKLPTFNEIRNDRTIYMKEQFKPDADGHLFLFTKNDFLELLGGNYSVISSERFSLNIFFLNQITDIFTDFFNIDTLKCLCSYIDRIPIVNKYASTELIIVAEKR